MTGVKGLVMAAGIVKDGKQADNSLVPALHFSQPQPIFKDSAPVAEAMGVSWIQDVLISNITQESS
jgi:hypothetical protein